MSIESARTMIETAENDTALQKQLQTAEGPEAILAIASEKGYDFTEEELLSVMQEKQLSFEEELSEDELESIAGGIIRIEDRRRNDEVRRRNDEVRRRNDEVRKRVRIG